MPGSRIAPATAKARTCSTCCSASRRCSAAQTCCASTIRIRDSSGYLTDPYKILSVVDPVTGEPVGARLHPARRARRHLSIRAAAPIRARSQSLYGGIAPGFLRQGAAARLSLFHR